MRNLSRGALFLSIAFGAFDAAQAAIVTFDDGPPPPFQTLTAYTSVGFDFTGQHFHMLPGVNVVSFVYNGTNYLAAEAEIGRPVTMTKSGGGTFSLHQFDIGEVWLPTHPESDFMAVNLVGNQSGGGTLIASFQLDGIADGTGPLTDFQTIVLNGWINLISVTISGTNAAGGIGDYAVDNLVTDVAQVPVPGALPLFVGGIGAMALLVRRRQRRVCWT